MNLLSTGPVWLFIVFGVVVALLPDTLIGVWEAYSAGEGVLVNQVKPIIYFPTFVC
jgi:phospholipid-translocating ATPase